MILAFLDDTSVSVLADEAEANRKHEGIDVENGSVIFYSDEGVWLEPHFTTPNRHGKFLGLFRWSESGVYKLLPPSKEAGSQNPIGAKLAGTTLLNANQWFKSLDELKEHLRNKGAAVNDQRPKA